LSAAYTFSIVSVSMLLYHISRSVLSSVTRPPQSSTLFPYTTLFRSLGMMNVLIAEDLLDRDYIAQHTLGFEALAARAAQYPPERSEEHTSELQSRENLVCRLLLEKKK